MWALPDNSSTNDESRLTLTYFMARSNSIPNYIYMEKILKCSFSITELNS